MSPKLSCKRSPDPARKCPELLGQCSLTPELCYLSGASNSDVRILSTWQKKTAIAINSFAFSWPAFSLPPLLLFELSFQESKRALWIILLWAHFGAKPHCVGIALRAWTFQELALRVTRYYSPAVQRICSTSYDSQSSSAFLRSWARRVIMVAERKRAKKKQTYLWQWRSSFVTCSGSWRQIWTPRSNNTA